MRKRILGTMLVLAALTGGAAAAPQRLVVVGAPVTELVFALGGGDAVVGRDTTSRFPEAAKALPDVGYMRTLSAEGLMSLTPTRVLAIEGTGPETALEQLRSLGVAVEVVPENRDLPGLLATIDRVAQSIGHPAEGERLRAELERALAPAAALAAQRHDGAPTVLCLVGAGPGGLMAAGRDTVADSLIRMAGLRNALPGATGYASVSAESATGAAPDYLLVSQSLLARSGGEAALRAMPQIAMTPAAKAGRLIVVDGALLVGFGPRTPEAVAAIAKGGTQP